jgi:hypothetical protein
MGWLMVMFTITSTGGSDGNLSHFRDRGSLYHHRPMIDHVSITTFSKICSVPVSILIIIKSPATANEKIFSVCSYTIQFYSSQIFF